MEQDLQYIAGMELPWEDFSGRTVLISGASGFLPACMVETLLYINERGNRPPTRVIGLVRDRRRAEARFAAYQGRSDLQLHVQDVCDPVDLEEPIHFIVHAASQASPKYYGTDPVGTLSANTAGTSNLLRLARDREALRFLFFSSAEVYGRPGPDGGRIAEDAYGYLDPVDVRSCYAESKRMGETMCVSWFSQFGVPAVIVRPFHTYGPGMRLDDGRVYSDFVSDVLNGHDIRMRSDGRATRAFCYLADAVAGFFTVLHRGAAGTAYNIGNDEGEMTIADLAELLAGLAPDRRLRVLRQANSVDSGYLASQVMRICPDVSRARSLGWRPTTGLRDGFSRTLRSFT
jgi:nucleoside-diphosphate-sugar epimerase